MSRQRVWCRVVDKEGKVVVKTLGRHSSRLKELRRRVRSRRDGEVIVDGAKLLDDLVRWDVAVHELYLTAGLAESERVAPWLTAAGQAWVLDGAILSSVAPTRSPQGVLAMVDEPTWPRWSAESGVAIYLEAVQDRGTVGAIGRTAAGLGGVSVLLSPGCADPFHPAAVRGSAGAVFRMPVEREITPSRAVDRLRRAAGEVWATGGEGLLLREWRPAEPVLLLLGAEGAGLDDRSMNLADGTVTIPLARDVESLNVAVAAGVLLQHVRG